MPDFNWGFNASNNYGQDATYAPEPESAPVQEPVTDEGNEFTPDAVEDTTDGAKPEGDAANEIDADSSASSPRGGKTKTGRDQKDVPALSRAAAKKILEIEAALSTDTGLAAARALLGANTSDHAALISQLTERKTRKSIDRTVAAIRKITADSDKSDLKMNLSFEFSSKKGLSSRQVINLLTAIAPQNGFDKNSGDPRRDAKNIADHWDDSIDLSVLDAFRL